MFYSMIQKGLDKWNAAFFCGSAAVLRARRWRNRRVFRHLHHRGLRDGLECIRRGWNSRSVDIPLIAGLQPEKFRLLHRVAFPLVQRHGADPDAEEPAVQEGPPPEQRIAYLSSSLFWFFPLPRLTFTFAPLLYIFFSLEIYVANFQEFVGYTIARMAVNGDCQEFCARGHDDGKERIITWRSRRNFLDQLLAGRDPNEVFAKDGLLDDLKKALSRDRF